LFGRRCDLSDFPVRLSLLAPSEAFQFFRSQMHFFRRWRVVEFIELQPVLGRDGVEHAKSVGRIRLLVPETEADQVNFGARAVKRNRYARMNPQLAALVQEDLLLPGEAGVSTESSTAQRV